MPRKIPIPHKIQTDSFFEKYSKEKNKVYACSLTVRDIVLHESNSEEYKIELILELCNYLFMNYNENNSEYFSPEVCSPNLNAYNSSTKNGVNISFESIAGGIDYYSDRWCWWRVWNVYRQTIELKRKIELKEK